MKIRIASLNCRGLNKQLKRKCIFKKCKSFDITCLQETHVTECNAAMWEMEWGGQFYYAEGSGQSKGQIILIHERVPFESIDVIYKTERILGLTIKIKDEMHPINIINVYGPNKQQDKQAFINNLYAVSDIVGDRKTFYCGDFNIVYCDKLDNIAGAPHRNEDMKLFNNWSNNCELGDVWRVCHGEEREYTWSRPNPFTARRLDYIFCNNNILQFINYARHETSFATDHRIVMLEIKLNKFRNGPSYWKFNNALLSDITYVNTMNDLIDEHLRNNQQKHKVHAWELLKVNIKSTTIAYCMNKARTNKIEENTLIQELEKFTSMAAINPDNANIINELERVRLKMATFELSRARGAQIRSRTKWIQEGEKNTKYFLGLEKHRSENNIIYSLDDENSNIDECKLVEQIKLHFQKLYKAEDDMNNGDTNVQDYLKNIDHPILSDTERAKSDATITMNELDDAVKGLNSDSAPGHDGLTPAFYKMFWKRLRKPLFESMVVSVQEGELSTSQKRGIITLIPKGSNLPKNNITNWRPLTLTNTDYKIITKVLAIRLQCIVGNLIHYNQSGFIKGRSISQHIRLIDDILNCYKRKNEHGMMISLDFQRAFDTVAKAAILESLQQFNFGPYFINLVKTIITNTESCVQNGGWISKFFKTERGIRQGCSVSPILFVLVVELAAIKIRSNNNINGLLIGQHNDSNTTIKILQYADDTTLFLKNKSDLTHALKDIEKFRKISGLQLNRKKSYGLWIGADAQIQETPGEITWVKPGEYIKILGIHFSATQEASNNEINWRDKINNVIAMIKRWQRRNLSLYGKIIIAKTFILSQFTYIIQSLALPQYVLNEIDSLMFKFIWKKKFSNTRAFEKVKRTVMCKTVNEGGLNMISIKDQQKVFLLKWLQKITEQNIKDACICAATQFTFARVGGVKYFVETCGDEGVHKENYLPSVFWTQVARTWNEFTKNKNKQPNNIVDILIQPLFNNCNIKYKGKILYFPKWIKAGVTHIAHIVHNKEFKNTTILRNTIKNNPAIQLEYNALINSIPNTWIWEIRNNKTGLNKHIQEALQKQSDKAIDSLYFLNQPTRKIRALLNQQQVTVSGIQFWQRKTGVDISTHFDIAHNSCTESRLRLMHFKILHNIYPTNILLNRMQISNTELCEVCRVPDYVEHFFIHCKRLRGFWESVYHIINSVTQYQFNKTDVDILFGIREEKELPASKADIKTANHIILLGKVCVSKMRYGKIKSIDTIFDLEWSLRKTEVLRPYSTN